jgi:hypothetical protein
MALALIYVFLERQFVPDVARIFARIRTAEVWNIAGKFGLNFVLRPRPY